MRACHFHFLSLFKKFCTNAVSLSLSAVNLSFCCCCCFLGSAVEKSNDSGYFYAVKYFALINSLPCIEHCMLHAST